MFITSWPVNVTNNDNVTNFLNLETVGRRFKFPILRSLVVLSNPPQRDQRHHQDIHHRRCWLEGSGMKGGCYGALVVQTDSINIGFGAPILKHSVVVKFFDHNIYVVQFLEALIENLWLINVFPSRLQTSLQTCDSIYLCLL